MPTEETRQDNFGNAIANPMTDLLDVPGHHDFTPERLRVYRNGSRIFVQYGDDTHYSETSSGHLLSPDAGDVMTLTSAQRVSYPVGYDLVPSMAWQLTQAPQSGDVVAFGFGNPDVSNFDPDTETYSGSDADGYFWYITGSTGLDTALFCEVRDGTVVDKETASLGKPADVWSRFAQWLNYYDVGPCRFIETFTDGEMDDKFPQQNLPVAAVSNDDGKGPLTGSKRLTVQVYQETGNSGLEVEVGSFGVSVPGRFEYIFKDKSHTQTFDVTNTTLGTYEIVGAIRTDPTRELVHVRIDDVELIQRPSDTTNAEVVVASVDPTSTNLTNGDFATPVEHSEKNSVVEVASDNTATGPDANDAGTDTTGATLAGEMANIGGYQIGRQIIRSQGKSSNDGVTVGGATKSRSLYDTDVALVCIDSDEAGTHAVDFITSQNI